MALFPDPNITNITALASYANTVTDNLWWNMALPAIWITLFLGLKGFRTEAAVVAASFVCALVSFVLSIQGLVNPLWTIGFVLLTAASATFGMGG